METAVTWYLAFQSLNDFLSVFYLEERKRKFKTDQRNSDSLYSTWKKGKENSELFLSF